MAKGSRKPLHPLDKPQAKALWLSVYGVTASVRVACETVARKAPALAVTPQTIYTWLRDDPEFRLAKEDADRDINDDIVAHIYKHGVTGWDETETTTETDPDGTVRVKVKKVHKYDSSLTKLLAQARMPAYKDRLDVTSNGNDVSGAGFIASVLEDPEKLNAACTLIETIAGYR